VKIATVVSTVAFVLVTAGCGSGASDEPDEPAGTPPARTEQTRVTEVPAEEPDAPAEGTEDGAGDAAEQRWTMPDLVGSTLQDAQDQVQSLRGGAIVYSASHDLSGADRNQVLDANWRVCTQNVAAGAPLTADATIDFGVVKLEESCP
jgi:hypothetical protein